MNDIYAELKQLIPEMTVLELDGHNLSKGTNYYLIMFTALHTTVIIIIVCYLAFILKKTVNYIVHCQKIMFPS